MVWVDSGILNDGKLSEIDNRIGMLTLPSDMGRLARKVSKCYKSMKADEWKHWTLVYSMFALQGVLPKEDLNIWCLFVKACQIICSRSISILKVEEAHNLLKMYCSLFQNRYGQEKCVPNMHLALHLKQCIYDYGSVYGFWCFSFERYNGLLGKYQTNNHSIAIQVMRKFEVKSQVLGVGTDVTEEENECAYLSKMISFKNLSTICGSDLEFQFGNISSLSTRGILLAGSIEALENIFKELYNCDLRISPFVKKFSRINACGETFSINKYRGNQSPYSQIVARYPAEGYINLSSMEGRPAVIHDLFEVTVIRISNKRETPVSHIMAECKFYKETEHKHFYGVNSPLKVWSTEFELLTFIPFKFVIGRYACCKQELQVQAYRNMRFSDVFNVVINLPSKSII